MPTLSIYYWTSIRYNRGEKPSYLQFKRFYVEMPSVLLLEEKLDAGDSRKSLDSLYAVLNSPYDTPYFSPEIQRFISENSLNHTCITPGDIIKIEQDFWLLTNKGWEKLDYA